MINKQDAKNIIKSFKNINSSYKGCYKISSKCIEMAHAVVDDLFLHDIGLEKIVPMADGGVSLWCEGRIKIIIENDDVENALVIDNDKYTIISCKTVAEMIKR